MKELIANNLDIILIILGICLSLMVIKLVTKILFKLMIVIVIIIGVFVTYQVFSGTNIIDDINTLYCTDDNKNEIKCTCFVQPIISDLTNKYSPEELAILKAKKLRANTEFIKSYKAQEKEIKLCFEKHGESIGILNEILDSIKKNGLKVIQ